MLKPGIADLEFGDGCALMTVPKSVETLMLSTVSEILVNGGGVCEEQTVTFGGARPKVMVVPPPLELVANLCPDTLVTIRVFVGPKGPVVSVIMIVRPFASTPS